MGRRIRVVGNSGSGKSYLARRLATRLNVPHLELDAVQHQPGWTEAPLVQFQDRVLSFVVNAEATSTGWVVDGNYTSRIGDLLDHADTVVWLDYPRLLVLSRVLRRTLSRLVLRRELWNGNRERWLDAISLRPNENIILWSWTQHRRYRTRYAAASDAEPSRWVRLRTPAQAETWLRSQRNP
jgi:adenylate kinase family enzyme